MEWRARKRRGEQVLGDDWTGIGKGLTGQSLNNPDILNGQADIGSDLRCEVWPGKARD